MPVLPRKPSREQAFHLKPLLLLPRIPQNSAEDPNYPCCSKAILEVRLQSLLLIHDGIQKSIISPESHEVPTWKTSLATAAPLSLRCSGVEMSVKSIGSA